MKELLTSIVGNYNNVIDHLYLGLRPINKSDGILTMPWHDLELFPYIRITEGTLSKVSEKLVDAWGVSVDQIFSRASRNTYEETEVCDMSDILGVSGPCKMLVVSNANTFLGAAGMISTNIMDRVANELETENVIILPSSIHEVICIAEEFRTNELAEMITDINRSVVPENEWLSDHPYLYKVNTKEFSIY